MLAERGDAARHREVEESVADDDLQPAQNGGVHLQLQLDLLALLDHPQHRRLDALELLSLKRLGGHDHRLDHSAGGLHQVQVLSDHTLDGGDPAIGGQRGEEVSGDVGELVVEQALQHGHLLLPRHRGVLEELREGRRGGQRSAEGLQLGLDLPEQTRLAGRGEQRAGVPPGGAVRLLRRSVRGGRAEGPQRKSSEHGRCRED